MSNAIWVYGAGGHAKVTIQTIIASGKSIGGVVDDDEKLIGTQILGFEINSTNAIPISAPLIVAIGDNTIRREVFEKQFAHVPERKWATVIHPSAVIDPTALIGPGSIVMANSVIQVDAKVGRNVIVNTSVAIDHDSTIEDNVHLCPGTTIAGHVSVGKSVMIGSGTTIIPSVVIHDFSTVGAGACVISDVPAYSKYVGVPAREIR